MQYFTQLMNMMLQSVKFSKNKSNNSIWIECSSRTPRYTAGANDLNDNSAIYRVRLKWAHPINAMRERKPTNIKIVAYK